MPAWVTKRWTRNGFVRLSVSVTYFLVTIIVTVNAAFFQLQLQLTDLLFFHFTDISVTVEVNLNHTGTNARPLHNAFR